MSSPSPERKVGQPDTTLLAEDAVGIDVAVDNGDLATVQECSSQRNVPHPAESLLGAWAVESVQGGVSFYKKWFRVWVHELSKGCREGRGFTRDGLGFRV